jgi:hypothetical protein
MAGSRPRGACVPSPHHGVGSWTTDLWQCTQGYPPACDLADEWHLVHAELATAACPAWYLLLWHDRHVVDAPLDLAWSFLLWQPLQTNFFVTVEECCARGLAGGALPLWQSAQREPDTFAPACFMA